MASCGLKVWCIKQSRGIQGYTGIYIYTSITGHPVQHTSIQLDSRNSSTRRRVSQGDVPTLIRFGGGLNALTPILTSWAACGACGPFSCPFPSPTSGGRGFPGHSCSSCVASPPPLEGQMLVAGVFFRTSSHSSLALSLIHI